MNFVKNVWLYVHDEMQVQRDCLMVLALCF